MTRSTTNSSGSRRGGGPVALVPLPQTLATFATEGIEGAMSALVAVRKRVATMGPAVGRVVGDSLPAGLLDGVRERLDVVVDRLLRSPKEIVEGLPLWRGIDAVYRELFEVDPESNPDETPGVVRERMDRAMETMGRLLTIVSGRSRRFLGGAPLRLLTAGDDR